MLVRKRNGARRARPNWDRLSSSIHSALHGVRGKELFVLAADIHMMHTGIRAAKQRYASFFPRG